MARLSASLFGPLRTSVGETPLTGFHSDKVRALLAFLLVEHDRPHRRETLAGLLWPGYPEHSARQSLNQALFSLRVLIGEAGDATPRPEPPVASGPLLDVSRTTISLLGAACDSDVAAFGSLVEACRSHGHPLGVGCVECIARLEEALALYQGELLAGFSVRDSPEFDEWLAVERERFRRQVIEIAGSLARQGEVSGTPGALERARRWAALDPVDEQAHRCLMRLLARAGHRAAALAQYDACRQILERELGVEPERATRELWERLRSEDLSVEASAPAVAPAQAQAPRPSHNLPAQVTSFVGRERESANLSRLLGTAGVRLVTLVSAGGMGKTRLALEVARAVLPRYPGGAWLVDLATLPAETASGSDAEDGRLVVRAVAGALGVLESASSAGEGTLAETVAGALRGREVLLLLDNCEHVLGAVAPLVSLLLARCPELTLLATSREPLHISGEVLYDLAPLAIPQGAAAAGFLDEGPATPEQALRYGAVRLLVERAAAIRQGYVLTGADLEPALGVCRLLDGMPLAIELAAAQLRALSLADVAHTLGAHWRADSAVAAAAPVAGPADPWRVLGDGNRGALPRQQTVRNTIAWSYDLLGPRQRLLFDRLAVFAGSFSLEGAESVAGYARLTPREVGPLLADLVDRSLVVRLAQPGTPRYRLLESLRAYAQERLDERGEMALALQRHAAYCIGLVEHLEPAVHAQEREAIEAYRVLDADADNLAAATRRALADGRHEDALRIGGAASLWTMQRPWFAQYAEWMRAALAGGREAAPLYRSKGWDVIGCWSFNWGLTDEMHNAATEELACARAAEDTLWVGHGLFRLGFALRRMGRRDEAAVLLREAADIGRQTGDGNMEICCRLALASGGSPAQARTDLEVLVRTAPYACRPYALQWLASAATMLGDLPAAEAALRESRSGWEAQGNVAMVATLSAWLAELLAQRGDYAGATELSERTRDDIVRFRGPWFGAEYSLRLARLAWWQGDLSRASGLVREALASALAQGNEQQATSARLELAVVAAEGGQAARARAYLAEGGAGLAPTGRESDEVLAARGRVALLTGDLEVAVSDFRQMLARARSQESRPDTAQASEYLAWALAEAGELEEAATLLEQARAEREAMGMVLYPVEIPHHERAMKLVAGR